MITHYAYYVYTEKGSCVMVKREAITSNHNISISRESDNYIIQWNG